MKTNDLDQALKEWGERNRPSAEALARLAAGLRESVARELPPAGSCGVRRADFRPWPRRWAALAAGLLALLAAGSLVRRAAPGPEACGAGRNGSMELARFSAAQVSARRAILDEMDALFAGQVRWIRLDADGLRLGMAEEPLRPDSASPRLAVRTVVVAREENQTQWRTIWSADVLTRAEEYVEIAPEARTAGALELWVHQLPDGRYAVDSDIDWALPHLARTRETRVLAAGQPERIWTQTAGGREYRIYQAIEPLANGQG